MQVLMTNWARDWKLPVDVAMKIAVITRTPAYHQTAARVMRFCPKQTLAK